MNYSCSFCKHPINVEDEHFFTSNAKNIATASNICKNCIRLANALVAKSSKFKITSVKSR